MLKFLKFSERFFHHQKIKFPKSFSSLQNLNFQNFYPLIKDLKNSETYEFKLQPESKDGSPVIFEILKTHTIEDFFSKFSENLEYKSLKAYSLDQIELSNKTLISHLENSNFYVLADEKHLFKVIDATKGNMKQENEIEKYCVEMDISYLQKNILVNYLSRLDILNEIKFGAKFFNNNENNNKLIDKDELIQNLVEALPSNRTSLVFHEEGLLNQYRLIKEEVEDLQNQKEQLEKIVFLFFNCFYKILYIGA